MENAVIKKVGVIGSGQMGSGIAQVCATSNYQVVLFDVQETQVQKAKASIEKSCEKLVSKGKLTEDKFDFLKKNLKFSHDFNSVKDCDLIIEAITEDETKKNSLFSHLSSLVKESAIFASNTSSISIAKLASASKRKNRFIGLHFMNPVPLMKLVEVVTTLSTDKEVFDISCNFIKSLGKEITVSKNAPGFVVNRILMPMINEAFVTLQEGVSSKEDIDKAMKLGTNQPMGPLELADFIGLDTCLAIMNVLHEGTGDSKYRPSTLLKEHVENGLMGRKSGQGVYSYS